MSIVRLKDKRTGTTYVYESESYWDKEKKQPRNKRVLIGKVDEATGETVPTDGRGRKRKGTTQKDADNRDAIISGFKKQLEEQGATIKQLAIENQMLKKDLSAVLGELNKITTKYEKKM